MPKLASNQKIVDFQGKKMIETTLKDGSIKFSPLPESKLINVPSLETHPVEGQDGFFIVEIPARKVLFTPGNNGFSNGKLEARFKLDNGMVLEYGRFGWYAKPIEKS